MDKKQLIKKEITALILMALLLLITGIAFLRMDYVHVQKKVQTQNQVKLDFTAEMIEYIRNIENDTAALSLSHAQETVRFMTAALAETTAAEGSPEPRLLGDGAIVRLQGNQAVFPAGVPEYVLSLSADDIRKNSQGSSETEELFCSGKISEDLYYITWPDETAEAEDPYAYLSNEEFQDMASESFRGLLIRSAGDDFSLVFESPDTAGSFSKLSDEVIRKVLANRPQTVRAGGSRWLCTYSRSEDDDSVLVWLMPDSSILLRSVIHTAISLVSELIIFVTLIHYFFSVLSYSNTHKLNSLEKVMYHPTRILRFLLMLGIAGAIAVVVSTAVFQTMDAIHEESIMGAKDISALFEYSEKTVADKFAEEKRNAEQRNIDHGEKLVSLFTEYPDLVSREKLKEYSDLFRFDYMMLFDTGGKEILSDSDYIGMTMDAGLGENSRDFRRLLLGVPSIIHEASTDPVTGLTRQFAGVRMPLTKPSGEPGYGALLMAIDPGQFGEQDSGAYLLDKFHFSDNKNRLYFYADPETGNILHASDPSLKGMTAMQCGLPERSLQEGFTDFTIFNGVQSYTTMIKQKAADFFYVIVSEELFSRTVPMALTILAFYIITALILGWHCLRDYSVRIYEALTADDSMKLQSTKGSIFDEYEGGSLSNYSELLVGNSKIDSRRDDKTPEHQVGTILKVDILLLVVLPMLAYMRIYGDNSLVRFILTGNWMRGINLFSFVAIVIVATVGIMVLVLANTLLSLIAGFTGKAGETACRMLYSLIYYIVILNILYYVFEYCGLAMSTYIASLGAVSLALSIGAQGMVADILAGLLIVFEHQFQVGDYVEIEGYKGKVLEIGIRSTRILGAGNDIRFINNSNIRNVVNKSIRNSAYLKDVVLSTQKSVTRIEELLLAELPKINEKYDIFLRGPKFIGFLNATSDTRYGGVRNIGVRIIYECAERDHFKADNYLTKELIDLCDREEIGLK